MKAYYYFLFRIYRYYKDKQNENEFQALFSATTVSSLVLNFHLIGIYIIANYFNLLPIVTNKLYMILFMLVIGCVNYYFFVRNKSFLDYGFQKDKKGGIYIVSYIILLGFILFVISSINREKIFEERKKKPQIEQTEKRESLEGKIREWFNE